MLKRRRFDDDFISEEYGGKDMTVAVYLRVAMEEQISRGEAKGQ